MAPALLVTGKQIYDEAIDTYYDSLTIDIVTRDGACQLRGISHLVPRARWATIRDIEIELSGSRECSDAEYSLEVPEQYHQLVCDVVAHDLLEDRADVPARMVSIECEALKTSGRSALGEGT